MGARGQQVDTSHSGGRTVWAAWVELLEANEKYWLRGQVHLIRTDTELVEQMGEWFPDRRSALMSQPRRQRAAYNRGRREVASFRYLRDMDGLVCRATARGTPASEWRKPPRKRNGADVDFHS